MDCRAHVCVLRPAHVRRCCVSWRARIYTSPRACVRPHFCAMSSQLRCALATEHRTLLLADPAPTAESRSPVRAAAPYRSASASPRPSLSPHGGYVLVPTHARFQLGWRVEALTVLEQALGFCKHLWDPDPDPHCAHDSALMPTPTLKRPLESDPEPCQQVELPRRPRVVNLIPVSALPSPSPPPPPPSLAAVAAAFQPSVAPTAEQVPDCRPCICIPPCVRLKIGVIMCELIKVLIKDRY